MKIIPYTDEIFMIVIPKSLYFEDKTIIIKKIKEIILTYNKRYHFLETGFYQIKVGFHSLIGTVLEMEKLDDFDFGTDSIDLRIIIVGDVKIGFTFEDLIAPISEFYLYKNKIYLIEEDIIKKNFYQIIEHGTIIFKDEIKEVKKNGVFCHIQ